MGLEQGVRSWTAAEHCESATIERSHVACTTDVGPGTPSQCPHAADRWCVRMVCISNEIAVGFGFLPWVVLLQLSKVESRPLPELRRTLREDRGPLNGLYTKRIVYLVVFVIHSPGTDRPCKWGTGRRLNGVGLQELGWLQPCEGQAREALCPIFRG